MMWRAAGCAWRGHGAQNGCSQDAVMRILKSASSLRNIKLRDVAASVVASTSGYTVLSTHFDK